MLMEHYCIEHFKKLIQKKNTVELTIDISI